MSQSVELVKQMSVRVGKLDILMTWFISGLTVKNSDEVFIGLSQSQGLHCDCEMEILVQEDMLLCKLNV
jgi:hypothetical protein